MSKKDIIRSIYLYLVTLVGLMMLVIPGVDMIKIGLENSLFPMAREDEYGYEKMPSRPYAIESKILETENLGEIKLTEDEKIQLDSWKIEYKNWEENQKNKDVVAIRTQKSLVRDISIFMGGVVLFFSHGYIILRERRKNKN